MNYQRQDIVQALRQPTKSNKPGPTVVFLAEYDALAGLGHGCGHNVFGATSSLAGAALKSIVDQIEEKYVYMEHLEKRVDKMEVLKAHL